MSINVFGNSSLSHENGYKIDTCIFVQKHYLITNGIDAKIEEDINIKNEIEIKNLPCPVEYKNALCKSYVDNTFKIDFDFNNLKLENLKIVQVFYQPAVNEHSTAKI